MAEKRKVDVFAGQGSLADKLRQRRQMLEDLANSPSSSPQYSGQQLNTQQKDKKKKGNK